MELKEPFLEPILRRMRINRVLPAVRQYPNCRLLDVGCGWEARLLNTLEPYIQKGVGIDFKAPAIDTGKIKTITAHLSERLPFEDASFDVVTMLAVLEHVDHPVQITEECCRVLRPGGSLVLTVPSHYAKPVLEFLSFRLGIVNPDEIRDHKQYFDREDLLTLIKGIDGLETVKHKYFQWRFNNHLVARKDPL